jgi:hypothetical protein
MIKLDMSPVDSGADEPKVSEGRGVAVASVFQPFDEIGNSLDFRRGFQVFFGGSDSLPNPGEVENSHGSSSTT